MRISDWSSDVCSSDLKYLSFEHPDCGVGFEIIEQDTDGQFEPWDSPYVPKEVALRGFHSWTATLNRNEEMDSFMRNAWNLKPQGRDGNYQRHAFGNGGAAKVLDVYIDEDESVTLGIRSEERTSELQSLTRNSHPLFCLQQK